MNRMDSSDKSRLGRRITLLSLALLFIASGILAIHNKDTLLVAATEQQLAAYGLTNLQLQQLQFDGSHISLASTQFTYQNPALGNIALQIQLHSINSKISWRNLLTQPIKELTIQNADIQLLKLPTTQNEIAADKQSEIQEPTRISSILPYTLIEHLPIQQTLIKHWQVNLNNREISGTTTINKDQSEITTNASLDIADTKIAINITSNPVAPFTLDSKWTADSNTLASLNTSLKTEHQKSNSELADSDFFWQTSTHINIGKISEIIENKESALHKKLQEIKIVEPVLSTVLPVLKEDKLKIDGHTTINGELAQPDALVLPPTLAQFFAPKPTDRKTLGTTQPEAVLTIENFLSIQESGDQFNLKLEDLSQLILTNDSWQLERSMKTEKGQLVSTGLIFQANDNWLQNSELSKTIEKLTGQKLQLYGAEKIELQSHSALISGQGFILHNAAIRNMQLSLFGGQRSPFNGKLFSKLISVKTPTTNPGIQSEFTFSLSNNIKNITHNWNGNFQLQNNQLNLTTGSQELDTTLTIEGDITAKHQRVNYTATSNNLATTFTQAQKVLPSNFPLPKALGSLELTQGNLALQGQIKLQTNNPANLTITNQFHWQAENITGLYNKTAVQGLKFSGKLTGLPGYTSISTIEPIHLTIKSLHAGAKINDLQWIGQLHAPNKDLNTLNIHTESFNAGMFSGWLALVDPFDYNLAQGKAQGTLRASAWQLSELVALQKNTIEAHGVLDGDLNFQLTPQGLEIPKGQLLARPPGGTIRYPLSETQAIIANSPELALTMRMLDNFNYHQLSTDIKLSNSGELHLGLNLNGMNPAELNGRHVEFNINVDQNVLPLLESLRLSDQLINSLEEKIKQHH